MTIPSFEEFLKGEPIITETLDDRKAKLTICLKNDKDSGLQYVEYFVSRHEKNQYHVFSIDEIRNFYNAAII